MPGLAGNVIKKQEAAGHCLVMFPDGKMRCAEKRAGKFPPSALLKWKLTFLYEPRAMSHELRALRYSGLSCPFTICERMIRGRIIWCCGQMARGFW